MSIALKIHESLVNFDSERIYVDNDGTIYGFEDCVENSFLQLIYLLNIDINNPLQIDLEFLKSKTNNEQLIDFFTKYPNYNEYSINMTCRNEWGKIVSCLPNQYYIIKKDKFRTRTYCKSKDNYKFNKFNEYFYELIPLMENFINIINHFFNINLENIPIIDYFDSCYYQKYLDIIASYFSREQFIIKFNIFHIFDSRNYDDIETEIDVFTNININGIDIWGVEDVCINE